MHSTLRRARFGVLASAIALSGSVLPALLAAPAHATPEVSPTAAISFTTAAPARGVIGSTYSPVAVPLDGATPVTLALDPASSGCSLSGGQVSFDHAGTCVIDANQTQSDGTVAAPAQQSIVVGLPRSCAEAVKAGVLTADGPLTVDMVGAPATVDCVNVTTNPASYIDLAQTGPGSNYGAVYAGGSWGGTTTKTSYTKVAVNTLTGQINPNDTTYSTTTGGPLVWNAHRWTQVPWGLLGMCANSGNGAADADLSGTGFVFPYGSAQFQITGWNPYGQVVTWPNLSHYSVSGLNATCGGYSAVRAYGQTLVSIPANIVDPTTFATNANTTANTIAVAPDDGSGNALVGQELTLTSPGDQLTSMAPLTMHVGGLAAGVSATFNATGACTVDPSTGVVTATGFGSCTVIANAPTPAGDAPTVPATTTFQIRSSTQLSFSATPGDQHIGTRYDAVVATTSGEPVSRSTNDATVCTVLGEMVAFHAKGSCVVTVSQTGDATHTAATAQQTLTVDGDLTQGSVTVSDNPQLGQPITATVAGWDTFATLSYDWKINGVSVSSGASYLPVRADAGQVATVTVTASAAGYWPATAVATSAPIALATQNAATVTLDGTPQVDRPVTASFAGTTPGATLSYAWTVDGQSVGADSDTYTPVAADAGGTLAVTVTETADGYQPTTATASDTVTPGILPAATVTIVGTPQVHHALTATVDGGTTGATYSYAWSVGGQPVGTDSATYTPTSADAGKSVMVTATEQATGYQSLSVVDTSAPVALDTPTVGSVSVSSGPQVGQPLTATASGWDADASLSYAWTIDGQQVGTDSATYTPAPADAGKTVKVTVTATEDGFDSATADASSAQVALGTLTAGTVTISGDARVDSTLTADLAGWDSQVTSWAYSWQVDGVEAGTASTYVVTPADAGKTITVTVTAASGGYADAAVTSAPTAAIANAAGLATGRVIVKGATTALRVKTGRTLTVTTTGWDPRLTLHYAWTIGGRPVKDGHPTLVVPGTAAGKVVQVTVTGTARGYDPVSVTASSILVVKNPTVTVTYTVAGRHVAGSTLTRAGHWADAPVTASSTCHAGTAALTACPAPLVLGQGRHHAITRTAYAADGGLSAVTVGPIDVDTTAPAVSVAGVTRGSMALVAPAHASCRGFDGLSGIASCRLQVHRVTTATGQKITYTATALDRAGNRSRSSATVFTAHVVIVGAPWAGGRFHVTHGRAYQVLVSGSAQPQLLFAAPQPRVPAGGNVAFHGAGKGRWTLIVTMTSATRYSHDWELGVRQAGRLIRVPLYVAS